MPWVWLTVLGASALGPPVRGEHFQLRPPAGFRMSRMDLFHGTTALAVSGRADEPRYVAAVLVDGEGEDAATLTLSVVQADLTAGPGARDALVRAVAEHFRDELDLPISLEGADAKRAPTTRVEVLGAVRAGTQVRSVAVAAWPHEAVHVVATFSAPAARFAELKDVLAQSLDTFHYDERAPRPPRQWALASAALAIAALLASVAVWRRRQAARG